MEHCWVVVLGLVLWLMPPCLDLTHELGPQQEWTYVGVNSVSEHETVWTKPSEVTPNPLLHHFDFHCVSCAMLGNSGLSNINQLFYMAFRMNQASRHSSEAGMRNQITGPFICPRNASHQGSWGQHWLLQLADLVPQVTRFWKTSDSLEVQDSKDEGRFPSNKSKASGSSRN